MEFHFYGLAMLALASEPEIPSPVTLEPRYPLARELVKEDSHHG